MLNEVIMLALKLEENAAYAVLTSSWRFYKEFPPRSAHAVANDLSAKPDQSKIRYYNCRKLGHLLHEC